MKKKIILIALIAIAVTTFTSCSRKFIVDKSMGGTCGVWYPKKCKIGTKGW